MAVSSVERHRKMKCELESGIATAFFSIMATPRLHAAPNSNVLVTQPLGIQMHFQERAHQVPTAQMDVHFQKRARTFGV